MSTDTELVVLFAILHVVALAGGGGLLLLALSGGGGDEDAHHEPGSGGDQLSTPPRRPTDGPPLTVAEPARVRLREPARFADLLPRPPRRGTPEPKRPAPTPTNSRPSTRRPPRMFRELRVALGWASMPIALSSRACGRWCHATTYRVGLAQPTHDPPERVGRQVGAIMKRSCVLIAAEASPDWRQCARWPSTAAAPSARGADQQARVRKTIRGELASPAV
jgi:hypothetical protein